MGAQYPLNRNRERAIAGPVGRFGGERNFNRFHLENEPGPLCVGIWMENRVLAASARDASLDLDCV